MSALSASSLAIRRIAYDCLARVLHARQPPHLERQAARLLHALKDAVTVANQQLPRVTTAFVAHGIDIAVNPTHPRFRALISYIVLRPHLRSLRSRCYLTPSIAEAIRARMLFGCCN